MRDCQRRGTLRTAVDIVSETALQPSLIQGRPSMLIGLEKRFIFVANTKCASTSLEDALKPYCDLDYGGTPQRKHIDLRDARKAIPEIFSDPNNDFAEFFKFGVMRDPIDWISSWFRYRKRRDIEAPIPEDMEFREFWALNDWNKYHGRQRTHYLQSDKFVGYKGRVLADVILPFNSVEEGFARICEDLGIPQPPLRKLNQSPKKVPVPVIPEDLIDEVRAHYADDYALIDRIPEINGKGFWRLRNRHNK